jgi:hypothetical protein
MSPLADGIVDNIVTYCNRTLLTKGEIRMKHYNTRLYLLTVLRKSGKQYFLKYRVHKSEIVNVIM